MKIEETVIEYLLDGSQSWRPATVRQYRWHLEQFACWLGARPLSRRALLEYAAYLRETYQLATVRVAVIALRGWLAYVISHHGVDPDLCDVLRIPRTPVTVQRTVSSQEVLTLLAYCDQVTPDATGVTVAQAGAVCLRNAAIVTLLYDSMLRAGELCRLHVAHVDVVSRRLLVQGKGGGESLVPFSPATARRLRAWLAQRSRWAMPDELALFVGITGNTPGQAITPSGLRVILRKLSQKAGIEPVSPHAFRRGGAVAAVQHGAPSRLVQAWGRWGDIRMVEVYTRNIEAARTYDRYSPMNGLTDDQADT